MRRLLLLLFIIVPGLFYYGYKNPRAVLKIEDFLSRLQADYDTQQTIISLTYQLKNDEWTEFPLPAAANRLKVLTNYIPAASETSETDNDIFRYSLDYQLINGETQTILKEGTYHFHTKVTLFQGEALEEPVSGIFLKDSDRMPCDGRIMQLDLESLPQPVKDKRIRFRNGSINPISSDALIRVYTRQRVSESKQSSLWGSLQTFEKEQLAKGNTFPQDFLAKGEIKQLMSNQWHPAGPAGIPDRHFTVRRLYIRRDLRDSIVTEGIEPPGINVTEMRVFTFAVPEEGKNLRFLFKSLHPQQLDKQQITVRWFGKLIHENITWDIPWDGEAGIFNNHFDGGIIEVEAEVPLQVSVFTIDDPDQEIQTEPLLSKMYISTPGEWLSYTVRHVEDQPTPIRIAVRALASPQEDEHHVLQYRVTDRDNTVFQEHTLELTYEKSRYDQLIGDLTQWPAQELSDPTYYYLYLPPEVTGLDFRSDEQLLVSVANRPIDFLQTTLVPENYFRSSLSTANRPTWFSFSPIGFRKLDALKKVALIKLQHRPPVRQQDLMAGRFRWESFRPTGKWQGGYLFVPKIDATPLRTEALKTTFHSIPNNKKLRVKVEGPDGFQKVKPDLIFVRKSASPFQLQVEIDGKSYFTRQVRGTRGVISLPAVTTGSHSLRITGQQDGQFFLSNLMEGIDVHTLRFGYRLNQQGIVFTYPKEAEEELLSFIYYAPCGIRSRTRIKVTLLDVQKEMGPFSAITRSPRVYDIRSGDDPPLPLLHSESGCTDNGQRFFFPMGADLPPGKYQFEVETENNSGGFVLMYRVTPGQYDWSRFFREEE